MCMGRIGMERIVSKRGLGVMLRSDHKGVYNTFFKESGDGIGRMEGNEGSGVKGLRPKGLAE